MKAAHPMEQYHDLMRRCIEEGEPVLNARTGERCFTLIGEQLKFNMADGFPAVTTKKLAFKTMVGELLGILRGATSAAEFRDLGCKVWDGNANETPAWLANPHRKGTDDLGRSYGSQWTDWTDLRLIGPAEVPGLTQQGFNVVGSVVVDNQKMKTLVRRGINQVEECARQIMTNPTNRQIVLSGWRPDEMHLAPIPVCHMTYTWAVNTRLGRLDLVMHQRSWDSFLAFNIPMSALFLHLMARLTGLTPGVLTMQIANAHVYEGHLDQVREQLSREHYPQPALKIADRIKPLASPADVKGAFAAVEPGDFELVGYQHHPALTAKMAV